MKITVVKGELSFKNKKSLRDDEVSAYVAWRGIDDIIDDAKIHFDFFRHLRRVSGMNNGQAEVFDGGCGYGKVLVDLKRGITMPVIAIQRQKNPEGSAICRLRQSYRHFRGLGDKIRTTGATLSLKHADEAASMREPFGIDELILGPIEIHCFDREYDFVLDFFGAAYYSSPEVVLPVYGRIIKPGRFGFVRLGTQPKAYLHKLFNEAGLEVLREGGYRSGRVDFIFKRKDAALV